MRICLLGRGDLPANPRVAMLHRSLVAAGNDVTIVCGGRARGDDDGRTVVRVPGRVPAGLGVLGRIVRRLQPPGTRRRSFERRLRRAVAGTDPDLIYAIEDGVVPVATAAAEECDARVLRRPAAPDAGDVDVVRCAPSDPQYSRSPTSPERPEVGPPPDPHPRAGRHAGQRVILAGRITPTTPARYLHAALERAGVDVIRVEHLRWSELPPDAAFALVVESPLPALEVDGSQAWWPVLFWAHHGEHHTDMQLRLVRRYGIDGVLMAHSWHLAHRFPVPTRRFPFAVAPELTHATIPWPDRRFDVAFVGARPSTGPSYSARRELLAAFEASIDPDRLRFLDGVPPEDLARVYGDSRVVINDLGERHHPITMRVFEAIGSGAVLATPPSPGLETLFAPGTDFVTIDPSDPASALERVGAVLGSPASASMAASAHAKAMTLHTYDHRVDELFAMAESWPRGGRRLPPIESFPLSRAIDAHPDVGSVADHSDSRLARALPLRAVWTRPVANARRYDAVAVGSGASVPGDALADAVRYVFVEDDGATVEGVRTMIGHAAVAERRYVGVVVFDLGAPGYRQVEEPSHG